MTDVVDIVSSIKLKQGDVPEDFWIWKADTVTYVLCRHWPARSNGEELFDTKDKALVQAVLAALKARVRMRNLMR